MVITETKFRNWAKKEYPNGFIKKIPDFKQMGNSGAVGLPDYLIIDKGKTIWYEVKSGFGDTINWNYFTDGQQVTFMKMYMAGADIKIYCFTKTKGVRVIQYEELLKKDKIKFK